MGDRSRNRQEFCRGGMDEAGGGDDLPGGGLVDPLDDFTDLGPLVLAGRAVFHQRNLLVGEFGHFAVPEIAVVEDHQVGPCWKWKTWKGNPEENPQTENKPSAPAGWGHESCLSAGTCEWK